MLTAIVAILRASLTRTKLKTAKAQVDGMVVDHVEKPSPNLAAAPITLKVPENGILRSGPRGTY
jgi:hypothetical protein